MGKEKFDYEKFKKEAIEGLLSGKGMSGSDNVLLPLFKDFLEGALDGEMDTHLKDSEEPDRRNGHNRKRVKTDQGSFELETPRDRNGDFEPELIRKRQTVIGEAFENRILSLYAKGLSYADIHASRPFHGLWQVFHPPSGQVREDRGTVYDYRGQGNSIHGTVRALRQVFHAYHGTVHEDRGIVHRYRGTVHRYHGQVHGHHGISDPQLQLGQEHHH